MLLQAVALPQQDQGGDPSAHFLGPEQAPRLQVLSTCPIASLFNQRCGKANSTLALQQPGSTTSWRLPSRVYITQGA